jgi:hypothetical protein
VDAIAVRLFKEKELSGVGEILELLVIEEGASPRIPMADPTTGYKAHVSRVRFACLTCPRVRMPIDTLDATGKGGKRIGHARRASDSGNLVAAFAPRLDFSRSRTACAMEKCLAMRPNS